MARWGEAKKKLVGDDERASKGYHLSARGAFKLKRDAAGPTLLGMTATTLVMVPPARDVAQRRVHPVGAHLNGISV